MNSASIGIEIVNGGHDFGLPPYPAEQIDAVIALSQDIVFRHGLRPERLLAHSDIAPGRKRDPGERFPWDRLFAAGLGRWAAKRHIVGKGFGPGGEAAEVLTLQETLKAYGYGIELTGRYDEATRIVVSAFQLHFRPSRVDGVADAETLAILVELNRP